MEDLRAQETALGEFPFFITLASVVVAFGSGAKGEILVIVENVAVGRVHRDEHFRGDLQLLRTCASRSIAFGSRQVMRVDNVIWAGFTRCLARAPLTAKTIPVQGTGGL